MRSLRGMTWGGYFYNLVSNEGKLKPASTTVNTNCGHRDSKISSSVNNNNSGGLASTADGDRQASPNAQLFQENASPTAVKRQEQDNAIEKLSNSITKLQDVSVSIGQTLTEHDEIANSLSDKIDDTNDYALSVTLRTAQMTQRATGSKAVLIGEYKLKTIHNNYLSVFDESITLTPQFNWSTVFRIYSKENNLFAIQNVKTRKSLGLNLWGKVVATSSGFGKNQEVHINLKGQTGVLFLNSNWGNGGWLKPDKDGLLRVVTSSLLDRDDRLLVTPLELTEADYKKLKNF